MKNMFLLSSLAGNMTDNDSAQVTQAFIYFHRIHPEAQRILGNSCIPVVSLERLNFQSVYLSSLQPVVSLVRLPCHTQVKLHRDAFCLDQQVKMNVYTR